jgi:serine protease Do
VRGRCCRTALVSMLIAQCFLACREPARSDGHDVDASTIAPRPPPGGPLAPSATAVGHGDSLVPVAPLSFAPIVRAADPSVVTIRTVVTAGGGRAREGVGTGFIIDKDGTILTNNHVVGDAKSVSVRLSDERDFPGEIIGTDRATDMAVVRIKAEGVKAIELADSDASEIGDWVVAIGNPFRLSHSVSVGIISGKGRSQEDVPLDPSGYYDFLQTDASINPGNSGGPLLNLRGQVVGINTAIRAGGAQNIGFAIPINLVKQLLPMLLRDGKISRSALGAQIVDLRDLTPEKRAEMKILLARGALIAAVLPGSGAAKAKLEAGDVVVAFEGEPIEKATRLQWLASLAGIGKTVSVKVSRQGQILERKVTLQERTESPGPATPQPSASASGSAVPDDRH